MKNPFLLLLIVIAFVSCDRGDKHQPDIPAIWSPVGHRYVSTDNSNYGAYLNKELIFISEDTLLNGFPPDMERRAYRIEYPLVYFNNSTTPWFKFIDTLTITKAYEMSDESARYELAD